MPLPAEITAVLSVFQSLFTAPTWSKVPVLLVGTLLARGRRTVAAALRHLGRGADGDFSRYHHVLNRARWSRLAASRRVLRLVVKTFGQLDGPVTLVVDETLERRWGRRIRLRGHYRDPLASSRQRAVAASGLRWLVVAVVVSLPWTKRHWALPVLQVPAPGPKVSERLGQRHKTVAERTMQVVRLVRRWLPRAQLTLTGDGAYSVLELGLACRAAGVRLVAPLALDARLFAPPPVRAAHQPGRPAMVGKRSTQLADVSRDAQTAWQPVRIRWYDQRWRQLEVVTGTALWYRFGCQPLPVRWVLVRDPKGRCETRAYFSTVLKDTPQAVLQTFIDRWTIEVTFEECRAHLGLETQRQWSDKAIGCSTPLILSLYSLVVLFAHALYPDGRIPLPVTAWYRKAHPTFADVLAAVRRPLWGGFDFPTAKQSGLLEIPQALMRRLEYCVCYAH
jgi:hypothetical protein